MGDESIINILSMLYVIGFNLIRSSDALVEYFIATNVSLLTQRWTAAWAIKLWGNCKTDNGGKMIVEGAKKEF